MLRYCLLFFMLLGITPAIAQSLDGVVADNDGSPLPAVIVVNKTKNLSTMADVDGKFSIKADKGDDIEFTYVGYYPVSFQMPEGANVFRRVNLKKKLYTLEEVEIRPDWTPYQLDSIARSKRYALDLSRKRASSTVMGSIFSPASALAEQFNKKSKQRTRFQENFKKWEGQKFVDTRYTPEEVTALTGLTGDTLAAFMNAYPMPYDYARAATDLEIKMWIKYNYRQWKQKPVTLPPPIPKETADTLKKP